MSKLETNTIDNISGSTTLTIGDSNTSTIALKSGATLTNFPDNTPAFEVVKSSHQTLADGTTTKITFTTETFDTASAYDTSTSKFTVPSGQAGKYFIYTGLTHNSTNSGQISDCRTAIYKNGSVHKESFLIFGGTTGYFLSLNTYSIMDLSVGDYIEIYGLVNVGTGSPQIEGQASDDRSYFGGYKIIE
jgi:hypothetical protein